MAGRASSGQILIVEDEIQIARPLINGLRRERYDVRHCESAGKALEIFRLWQPDVVLLDLTLPDGDGRDVVREIRSISDVPLLIISARQEETERITALELGADDFLTKPFSFAELLTRIRAVTRRARPRGSWAVERLAHGALVLDLEEHRVFVAGKSIELTNKEFEVLKVLIERPGKVVRRSELAAAVWDTTPEIAGKTIDVHISWLRTKLGGEPQRFIETVRGVGFRLRRDEEPSTT